MRRSSIQVEIEKVFYLNANDKEVRDSSYEYFFKVPQAEDLPLVFQDLIDIRDTLTVFIEHEQKKGGNDE